MHALGLAAALFFLAISAPAGARAEIKVEGAAGAVRIEATGAPLGEFLGALKKSFGLEFHSSAPLDQIVNGSFSGSLQEVVSSVLFLKDYNFVYAASGSGPSVEIFSPAGEGGGASPMMPRNPPMATAAMPPNGGRPFPPGAPPLAGGHPGKRGD
jgi:hypothetical protein